MDGSMMLQGKVIAVTGGGRGIGRAVALACSREGAAVLVNDPGVATDGSGADARPAQQTVAEITAAGGLAYANFGDIAKPAGALSVIEDAIVLYKRIDGVINCAGILRDVIWHNMTRDQWDAVIDVHLGGAYNISRAATPHFKQQQSGSFVHFTSAAGLIGNVGQANYAAAKMGVVGLSQSLALDMARYGVRSNCIAPIAYTRMVSHLAEELSEDDEGYNPLKTMSPAKVAPLAVYLASDAAMMVSNQIFGVQGDEICVYSKPRPIRSVDRPEGWSARTIADELIPELRGELALTEETAQDWFPPDRL
jgi:NAD(P)-dependent dehydrogenase (short-subunit alcohol dehydrogenase family)